MTVSEQFKSLEGTFEVDLGTVHHFTAGTYAKEMHLPKGYSAYSHKHTYDHLSILAKGVAVVTTDSEQKLYKAPACIQIKAGVNHKITAFDDVTWFCIHATQETDPDKVDQVLIGE
jgi:quercetin dioxygenase-like cupin family protein